MIILGAILLILGFILDIPILWTIGIVLLVVGVILYVPTQIFGYQPGQIAALGEALKPLVTG